MNSLGKSYGYLSLVEPATEADLRQFTPRRRKPNLNGPVEVTRIVAGRQHRFTAQYTPQMHAQRCRAFWRGLRLE